METYIAGALCDVDANLSKIDPEAGTCGRSEKPFGARPDCWFAPTEEEQRKTRELSSFKRKRSLIKE
jgi:hypothetical protein